MSNTVHAENFLAVLQTCLWFLLGWFRFNNNNNNNKFTFLHLYIKIYWVFLLHVFVVVVVYLQGFPPVQRA